MKPQIVRLDKMNKLKNKMKRIKNPAELIPEAIVKPVMLRPIGFIRSELKHRDEAPCQGFEGGPDAWVEMNSGFAEGLHGLEVGEEIIIITWLHKAERQILKVHPRGDRTKPLTGVFATRSPGRPNPLGLHRVTIHQIAGSRLRIGPIEAIDGTPVVDIKPALPESMDA
jgi:tRNA-Thr(GGU) m(6)t(6)A37 methyltransferase TsaA